MKIKLIVKLQSAPQLSLKNIHKAPTLRGDVFSYKCISLVEMPHENEFSRSDVNTLKDDFKTF